MLLKKNHKKLHKKHIIMSKKQKKKTKLSLSKKYNVMKQRLAIVWCFCFKFFGDLKYFWKNFVKVFSYGLWELEFISKIQKEILILDCFLRIIWNDLEDSISTLFERIELKIEISLNHCLTIAGLFSFDNTEKKARKIIKKKRERQQKSFFLEWTTKI